MQNSYPLWKNFSIITAFLVALIYALPNLYGEDPSVQVSSVGGNALSQQQMQQVEAAIKATGVSSKAF